MTDEKNETVRRGWTLKNEKNNEAVRRTPWTDETGMRKYWASQAFWIEEDGSTPAQNILVNNYYRHVDEVDAAIAAKDAELRKAEERIAELEPLAEIGRLAVKWIDASNLRLADCATDYMVAVEEAADAHLAAQREPKEPK